MLKQDLIQTCCCGSPMEFPEGEVKATCSCGAVWEIGDGGCWFSNFIIPIAPIMAKQRNSSNYDSYMRRRSQKRRRKPN